MELIDDEYSPPAKTLGLGGAASSVHDEADFSYNLLDPQQDDHS